MYVGAALILLVPGAVDSLLYKELEPKHQISSFRKLTRPLSECKSTQTTFEDGKRAVLVGGLHLCFRANESFPSRSARTETGTGSKWRGREVKGRWDVGTDEAGQEGPSGVIPPPPSS